MLYSVYFILCSAFPLTMPIIWAAILLYDYCLTFIAEVERCWVVRRLSWNLGFFYLNRYLTLLGYVPIMLGYFWSTSNPNKTEVCVLLLKSPGPEARWNGTSQMLVFVHVWHSKIAMKSNNIFCPVVTTCNRFKDTSPLSFRWSLLVGLFFCEIL